MFWCLRHRQRLFQAFGLKYKQRTSNPRLRFFEVALFCFKGKALLICIAQPNGLG